MKYNLLTPLFSKPFRTVVALCLLATSSLLAQPTVDGLVAYFPFDGYPLSDNSGVGNRVIINGDSTLSCGVRGNSLRLDGIRSEAIFIGPVSFDYLKKADFTVAFYFKAFNLAGGGTMDIMSKRRACNSDSSFAIRYTPSSNTITVEVSEREGKRHVISKRMEFGRCWYHICVVRASNRLYLYVNGAQAGDPSVTATRVDITNDAPLAIAKSPCIGSTDRKLSGYIDELRVYNKALNIDEIATLFFAPDRIATRDTLIFLGDSILATITPTCATAFQWSPRGSTDIRQADSSQTIIRPKRGGRFKYTLAFRDGLCTALDTLQIDVIDTDSLDCSQIFLPTAFSPNGDLLNDEFFISNPYAISEFTSLEIIDGLGSSVFYSEDKFARWDGTFQGKLLNPAVFVWKARFRCRGQAYTKVGVVTILK